MSVEQPLAAGAERRLLAWSAALFLLVHAVYWALGLRFNARTLDTYWQFLDPPLLRERLVESLLYLHSQPPLFNLLLGLVLKSTAEPLYVFHGLYLLMGLSLYVGLQRLMGELGLSRGVALGVATGFLASPSFMLYEHWLFYSFPLALLLVVSALCLARFLRTGRSGWLLGFTHCLLVLGWTWSLFHPLYFLLGAALVGRLRPAAHRQLLLASAVPLLLLLAVPVKNLVLFERFTSSTWLGMNWWGVIGRAAPLEARQRWVAEGRLSPVALVKRFSALEHYPQAYRQVDARAPAVQALVAERKVSGAVNFNHEAYIAISDQYLRDALVLLRWEPLLLLKGLAKAWGIYLLPPTDYVLLRRQSSPLAALIDMWDRLVHVRLPSVLLFKLVGVAHPLYLTLLVGLPWLMVYATRAGLGYGVGRSLQPEQRGVVLWLCFNILYVALVGNLLEAGENNRFRFTTDPLSVALLGLWVQHAARTFARRAWHRFRSSSPAAGAGR